MHKGLSEPHVLLASSNPQKIIKNLAGILNTSELAKIQNAVDENVVGLFKLGETHLIFALKLEKHEWRQRISRLYYAAYNVKRAVQLKHNGCFSTDVTDHQKVDELPDDLPNASIYKSKLKSLRDDRNLADYSHLAKENDLLDKPDAAQAFVESFVSDAKTLLTSKGIVL